MSSQTSEQLLQRYAHDLERSSKELFERYAPGILKIASNRLPENLRAKLDENDILQDTMTATFQAIEQTRVRWRKKGDLRNYILGIMQHKIATAIEHFSAQKRHVLLETRIEVEHTSPLKSSQSDVSKLISARLNELCDGDPIVLSILKLQHAGYSQLEIASRLNKAPRSVRRIIRSFRNKLIESGLLLETPCSIQKNEMPVEWGQLQYEDFQLLEMIGMGSFAKVYLARQLSTEKCCAFKAIRKKWLTNTTVRSAFMNEAHKLQKINDPNVVATLGLGDLPNGGVFLLLEYVPGPTLNQAIIKADIRQRSIWMTQIYDTVDRLHESGITHRDLNSHNIIIQSDGQIKLIDFAFSKTIRNFKSEKNEDIQSLKQLRHLMDLRS